MLAQIVQRSCGVSICGDRGFLLLFFRPCLALHVPGYILMEHLNLYEVLRTLVSSELSLTYPVAFPMHKVILGLFFHCKVHDRMVPRGADRTA